MPVVLPTPAEIDSMPPLQRRKARAAVARIALETTTALDRQIATADHIVAWAEQVRVEARRLRDAMPNDPDDVIRDRRATVLNDTYGRNP